MFNCALILIKFICHTSRSQAVCSQINVIRPEQELKHHTLVPDRYIWISNWISHQTNKISKTFLISMAPEARLAASAIGHRGQSQRWVAVFHLSLCKFLERSSKHKEENDKKVLSDYLRSGDLGQAVVCIPFFPSPYLFSSWKTMWGTASVHCVGEMQSLTSLLAVQQCTLQQPVMCRLLPHICIIIYFFLFFFFPTLEYTWCVKMVGLCLSNVLFHF